MGFLGRFLSSYSESFAAATSRPTVRPPWRS